MLIIPAFGRLRQEFEASLGYTVSCGASLSHSLRSCLETKGKELGRQVSRRDSPDAKLPVGLSLGGIVHSSNCHARGSKHHFCKWGPFARTVVPPGFLARGFGGWNNTCMSGSHTHTHTARWVRLMAPPASAQALSQGRVCCSQ